MQCFLHIDNTGHFVIINDNIQPTESATQRYSSCSSPRGCNTANSSRNTTTPYEFDSEIENASSNYTDSVVRFFVVICSNKLKLLAKQLFFFLQNTEYYSALDHFKQNIIPPAQYLKVCEGGCTCTTFH